MRTVLITTSGIGSRLGEYTEHTNKSLVRVGEKFAICHIIDKFDQETTRFVITLGYYGNLIREFLDLAYVNNKFVYVTVDKYQGEGSSLAYSLLQARRELQCPFTFFCCDSIILDDMSVPPVHNCVYVASSTDASSYATINTSGSEILKINSKGEKNFDYVYTGVSHIHDFEQYWSELHGAYVANPNDKELGDVNVLKKLNLRYKVLSNWFDIGNINSYNKACEHFKCNYNVLYKKDESICFFNDRVIKFFNNEKKNDDRVKRGESLGSIVPKILGSNAHFFSMELVNGCVLSEYYVHGEVYNVLNWAQQNLWVDKNVSECNRLTCHKFYMLKTCDRIRELNLGNEFSIINGVEIKPIKELINQIDWVNMYTDTFYKFHGDFIMDNIIKTQDSYKLIDWRQDFGGNLLHGDMYYDLAKFRHNIIFNHLNVESGLFTLKFENTGVVVDLKCNYFLVKQLEDFDKFVREHNLDLKKIKILTALIWLNMAPLHEFNISKFLFYFGKYNLHLELNSSISVL
jgi:hypothetical protein